MRLPRVFSLHDYFSLSAGFAIGLGWVIVPSRMLVRGGPLGVILAVLGSGVLLLFVAKCYAELSSAYPAAGGEVVFAYSAFGRGAAFSIFWFLCLGFLQYGPFYANISGLVFESLVPQATTATLYSVAGREFRLSYMLPGFAIGVCIVLVNYWSSRAAAKLQTLMLYTLLALVSLVAIVALVKGQFSNMYPPFVGVETIAGVGEVVVVVMSMICWYIFGFAVIAQTAEERRPDVSLQSLGKVLLLSLIATTLFYVVIHLLITVSLPWRETTELRMPTADAVNLAFGYSWSRKAILIAGLLGIATTLNACLIGFVRIVLSGVRAGFLPAWFGKVDQGSGTLKNAVLFAGGFVAIGPVVSIAWLPPIMGPPAFVCAFLTTCVATWRLRQSRPDLPRPCRVKHQATVYVGILVSFALFVSLFIPGAYEEIEWPRGYGLLFIWAALGYGLFRWPFRNAPLAERDALNSLLSGVHLNSDSAEELRGDSRA